MQAWEILGAIFHTIQTPCQWQNEANIPAEQRHINEVIFKRKSGTNTMRTLLETLDLTVPPTKTRLCKPIPGFPLKLAWIVFHHCNKKNPNTLRNSKYFVLKTLRMTKYEKVALSNTAGEYKLVQTFQNFRADLRNFY